MTAQQIALVRGITARMRLALLVLKRLAPNHSATVGLEVSIDELAKLVRAEDATAEHGLPKPT